MSPAIKTGFSLENTSFSITSIDYIYGYEKKKGKFAVRRKGRIEDHVASDHCPVYVDVYYEK